MPKRVTAERKKGAMAERQYATEAPDEIERERQHGVAEILAGQRHHPVRRVQGGVRGQGLVEHRDQQHEDADHHEADPEAAVVGKKNAVGERGHGSALGRPTAQSEQAAGPALDEQDDEHQHQDLAQDGAGEGFEQLVDDAETAGAEQRAP